jgi:hypothetical protein
MGWAWAHRLAGPNPVRHARVLAGAAQGIFRPAPPLPLTVLAMPLKPGDGLERVIAARTRKA